MVTFTAKTFNGELIFYAVPSLSNALDKSRKIPKTCQDRQKDIQNPVDQQVNHVFSLLLQLKEMKVNIFAFYVGTR